MLHLRQTLKDIYRYGSLGLKKSFLDDGGMGGLACRSNGELDQAEAFRGLQIPCRKFLEWAFGPNGLRSLDVVAFGDFAISDGTDKHNIVACRDVNEGRNF